MSIRATLHISFVLCMNDTAPDTTLGLHATCLFNSSFVWFRRNLWERTSVCALDAEWQPNVRIAKATLVQLALRTASTTLILLLASLCTPVVSLGMLEPASNA